MAKPTFKPNPRVEAIFDDLEQLITVLIIYELYVLIVIQ